ncbi:hypothetical protein RhiJN_14372 [Ceratobasidium sp. AG-Ba]|nr:hypothetical protein RhiJN_14372 [Ceratobasidium sp. AG-Ba]
MSDAEIDALAHAVFDAMLEDVVLGIALDEHKAELRNRAVCGVCHSRCLWDLDHINGATNGGPSGASTSTTNGNGTKSELPVLLDCIKCQRQVTPNRYANHLAGCLGLGNTRRAGGRNTAGKGRNGADSGAVTPVQRSGSVNGTPEELGTSAPTAKPKAPSKKKKKADVPDSTNGNNKREGAEQPKQPSKAKKQKVGKAANGKPLSFQPADLEEASTPSVPSPSPGRPSTVTRVPSKLQNSQTPISPAASTSTTTTPTHTPQLPPAAPPPRMIRGTGPPRPLLGRGPSVPRTTGVIDKAPPPPVRQSSKTRTEPDGDLDDLVDTASDSSDDT